MGEPAHDGIGDVCQTCGSASVGARFCVVCGADRTSPLTVIKISHMVGPMWSIDGMAVTAAEASPRVSLLQKAVQVASTDAPWRITFRGGESVERVVVASTGAVVDVLDGAAAWGLPERATTEAVDADPLEPGRMVLVGAHTGAGASTWAQLLNADDAETTAAAEGRIVVVCRSVPAGIAAAKTVIREVGPERVQAVLVVADAPGKPVPAAVREQRVLAGAVAIVFVPWMPRLRGVTEISAALDGQLARTAQRVSRALLGASTKKKGK
jgi:hypothetical protein